MSACQCQNATGDPSSAPRAESLTMRRTPAAAARSTTVHSWSTCSATLAQARKTASTPSRAASSEAGRAKSPRTTSTGGQRRGGRVAHEGAHLDVGVAGEEGGDGAADVAGRSGDEDAVHDGCPSVWVTLRLKRKTLSGS